MHEVRLINEHGEQLGIFPTHKARDLAKKKNLDLVEVAPQARPPVCRLIDYGKFKYEMEKKTRDSRKSQSHTKLKEIRMQPKIDSHDLQFKSKHVLDFLQEGNKCKVSIRFRGREFAHTHLGEDVLNRVLDILGEGNYILENPPKMEGRFMSMLLSPKKTK